MKRLFRIPNAVTIILLCSCAVAYGQYDVSLNRDGSLAEKVLSAGNYDLALQSYAKARQSYEAEKNEFGVLLCRVPPMRFRAFCLPVPASPFRRFGPCACFSPLVSNHGVDLAFSVIPRIWCSVSLFQFFALRLFNVMIPEIVVPQK